MRLLSGVTAAAMALTLVGMGSVPAHAETSSSCPDPGSRKILTAGTAKLWVYPDVPVGTVPPVPNRVVVCFSLPDGSPGGTLAAGALVLAGPFGSTQPDIDVELNPDPTLCGLSVLPFPVDDPVPLTVQAGITATHVCARVNDTSVAVEITYPSIGSPPVVELWRDADSNSTSTTVVCTYRWYVDTYYSQRFDANERYAACLPANDRIAPPPVPDNPPLVTSLLAIVESFLP